MTICVSALAAEHKAIVCVADKALSYDDQTQWDSDGNKMIQINPSGTLLMFSGDELPLQKVTWALHAKGKELWYKERTAIVRVCEDEYKLVLDKMVEDKFLTPRLLKRTDYIAAVTSGTINSYIKQLAEDLAAFELACDLLVCGFDFMESPFILEITSPGIATDMTMTGFHAIGSGHEKAKSRLLFSEHKRIHSIERTLYDAFDAKAFAEMSQGVGYEWDATIITKSGFHPVPEDIKKLIEKVWARSNRSPFDKYNPKEDEKSPPKNWKEQLAEFSSGLQK